MLKQILAVVAGIGFGIAVFAADVELKDDHPDTYVVQKGDTLWDIAGRFLNQPWLWPEIWQVNPQIANPHLIYPGDRLSMVYIDGRPRLMLGERGKLSPRVRREPLADAITTVPLGRVLPFLKNLRVLDKSEVEQLPYVVALEENRLRATSGQLAYVRGLDARPGQRVLVVRPTWAYYDYTNVPDKFWRHSSEHVDARPWDSERGRSIGRWWKGVMHNRRAKRAEYLGHEVEEIGEGEVLRSGDPSTVLVRYGDVEIRKGDLVMVAETLPYDLTFQPRAPERVPENLHVVAFTDALYAVGPNQVVALSRGARDGIQNGHVFSVFHPGDTIRDEIEYPEDDTRALFRPDRAELTLPEEFVGHVMVFRTFDKMSYGLVMDGIRPVTLHDRLYAPVR